MPMIISMPYGEFVMSVKDAVAVMEILEKSEKYQSKYHGSGVETTHHIYTSDQQCAAKLITDDMYRMAKLAGKPEEK